VSIAGLLNMQNVHGNSDATATSRAESTASGTFSGLSLLDGLIQIGASSFSAEAQSDGVSPSGTETTNFGTITIAGIPASVGSGGLVLGPAGGNLSGLLNIPITLVDQIVSAINLNVSVLPETQSSTAPTEAISSGGLSISFTLPSNLSLSLNCKSLPTTISELNLLCHVPDELQGLKFAFTLGRVTASAFAAQPFSVPSVAPLGGLSIPIASTPAFSPGVSSSTSAVPASSLSPSTTTPPSSTQAPPAFIPRVLQLVSLSSPIGASLLILLLLAGALFGFGFRRFATRTGRAIPADVCPLEEEP
jgi:hypothetical protein